MKKFKFRLQRVQDYRATVRDDKKRELLLRNQKLQSEQEHLELLLRAQLENENPQGVIVVEDMLLRGFYGHRLREEIAMQHVSVADAEEAVKGALAEYIEAAKNVRTLETLKAHRLSEYWEEYHREEGKFLDELAVQRGNRLTSKPTEQEEEEYGSEEK